MRHSHRYFLKLPQTIPQCDQSGEHWYRWRLELKIKTEEWNWLSWLSPRSFPNICIQNNNKKNQLRFSWEEKKLAKLSRCYVGDLKKVSPDSVSASDQGSSTRAGCAAWHQASPQMVPGFLVDSLGLLHWAASGEGRANLWMFLNLCCVTFANVL